ncbi:MAG: ROK family transcriptional regulator [Phycisphaeraceae bacterium]
MPGVPAHLRRLNVRAVFDRLRQTGGACRADLAKATGLSVPTVGKVADELLESGYVEEIDATSLSEPQGVGLRTNNRGLTRRGSDSALGRPARMLRLNRQTHRLLALQLGVRTTRLAALPIAGPDDERWPLEFATPRSAAAWARRLAAAAADLDVTDPWAVAISVPGVVDEPAGRVLLSPNLHWTQEAQLASIVRSVWDVPVCLVQEIRALALGHMAANPACRGAGDFLLVDFGQGVGAAAVIDHQLYQSPLPLSGELGHTPVQGNTRKCGCGGAGCIETLLSRQGLLQSYVEHHRGAMSSWQGMAAHIAAHGIERWLAGALDAAALIIVAAMNMLGVRQVVITGALAELGPGVVQRLGQRIERSAMWSRFGTTVCQSAPRRRAAGLVAAAIDRVLLPVDDDAVRFPVPLPSEGEVR